MARTKDRQPRRVTRLIPSAELSPDAKAVFGYLVQSVAPEHFSAVDLPLLESYCTAIVNRRVAQAAIDREGQVRADGKVSPWVTALEKAVRSEVALSMRLRLSPQSRFDRQTAGTSSRPQLPSWENEDPLLRGRDDPRLDSSKLAYYRLSRKERERLAAQLADDEKYFAS